MLSTLLDVQTTPHIKYRMGWWRSLRYNWNLGKRIFKEGMLHPLFSDLSSYRLSQIFQKIKTFQQEALPKALILKKSHMRTDPVKLLEIFDKSAAIEVNQSDMTAQKYRKLLHKTLVYLEIFKASEAKLSEQSEIRKWLRDSGINLMKKYKEAFGDNDHPTYEAILGYFTTIIDKIEEATRLDVFKLPNSPEKQAPARGTFEELLVFDQPLFSIESFKRTGLTPILVIKPLNPIDFDDNEDIIRTDFNKWMKICDKLSKEKRLEELKFNLQDIFFALESADEAYFWNKIPNKNLEEWSGMLETLCLLFAQIHFGTHQEGPLPQQMLHLFKILYRVIRLASFRDEKTAFDNFTVDMEPFIDILKDPNLDLGIVSSEIKIWIKAIQNLGIPLDLTTSSNTAKQPPNDRLFFKTYRKRILEKKRNPHLHSNYDKLEEDFGAVGSGLSKQVIHLRRMKIVMLAMMAKYRCLGNPGLWGFSLNMIRSLAAFLKKKATDIDSDFLSRIFDGIDQHLNSTGVPSTLRKNHYLLHSQPTVTLEEYDIDFLGYDPHFIAKYGNSPFASDYVPSQFKRTAQEVPPPISSQVIEACLANGPYPHVDVDGFAVDPTKDNKINPFRYIPPGEHKTEREIYNDRLSELGLPFDFWAELRAIQSSPLGMRIPDTLALFSRYPNYLTHPRYGLALQRVFSLNFFCNAALYEYTFEKPRRIISVLKGLYFIHKSLMTGNNKPGLFFIERMIEQTATTFFMIRKIYDQEERPFPDSLEISKYLYEREEVNTLLNSRNKPDLIHNNAIHHAYLLYYATFLKQHLKNLSYDFTLSLSVDQCFQLLESYYFTRKIPQPIHERNREHEGQIAYLMHRLFPFIMDYLKDNTDYRNNFINRLTYSHIKEPLTWVKGDSSYSFKASIYEVDLASGLLYKNKITKCHLPDTITCDPVCKILFDSDKTIHEIPCKRWNVHKGNEIGQIYRFVYRSHPYCIVLMPGQERMIFKKMSYKNNKSSWHQLQRVRRLQEQPADPQSDLISQMDRLSDEKERILQDMSKIAIERNLPGEVVYHFYWASSATNRFIVEEADGHFLLSGLITIKKSKRFDGLSSLSHVNIYDLALNEGGSEYSILNPWNQLEFQRFLALGTPRQLMALGKAGKVTRIKYLDDNLEYAWDVKTQTWSCVPMAGYALSSKKIEEVIECKRKNRRQASFFDSSFTYYHLLEHPTRPYRILLLATELQRAVSTEQGNYLAKYNRKQVSPKFTPHAKIYQYDVDPLSGLKSTTSEGYLYLAYVLFTQSKYDQALFYLTKAQNIKPGKSKESEQIISWFTEWKTTSKSAHVVLLHVHLLVLQQLQREKIEKSTPQEQYIQLLKVLISFHEYLKYKRNFQLDPRLALTHKQRTKLLQYCISQEKYFESLKDKSLSFLENFDFDLSSLSNQLSTVREQEAKNREDEKAKLDIEISSLRKQIEDNKKALEGKPLPDSLPSILLEEPSPLFPDYLEHLGTEEPDKKSDKAFLSQIELFQQGVCKLKDIDPFAHLLAMDLLIDTLHSFSTQKAEENKLKDDVDLDQMNVNLKKAVDDYESQAYDLKVNILAQFRLPMPYASNWDSPINRLRESSDSSERYFMEALYCCYTGDWRDLTGPEIVKINSIAQIQQDIVEYLKIKTTLQQYQKALDSLRLYQDTKLITHLNHLGEILSIKRYYDPDNDPNRFKLLLLEHEQKVIVTKDQVESNIANSKIPNLFIHRSIGGGKTTISRNLDMHPDGIHMAGAVTDEALIDMHHEILERTTLEAYGQLADRFEFSRGDPSDPIALRIILRNFLKIIAHKGRMDFSKKGSFKPPPFADG